MAAPVFAGLTSIAIQNPSFHADALGAGNNPGYTGAITGWTAAGATGLNGTDFGFSMHFSDGTTVDGGRLAFIQGPGSLSQNISGLTPGSRYVFQGWFRARSTPGVPVLGVDYAGQSLISGQSMTPGAAWQGFSVPFTAGSASGNLAINSAVPGGGDGTLALDAIQVFQLDSDYVTILNPSFESGTSYGFPGYVGEIAGWTKSGPNQTGYNHALNSPFADNGLYPEGATVAFIQQSATLSQILTGLTPGQQYLLELDYNSREFGDDGHIKVDLGGSTLLDSIVAPVGGSNAWHHLAATWTAGGTSATLAISGIANGGDSSIVFDKITLRAIPEPSSAVVALLGLTALGLRRKRQS
jgi:MYXO-CTERM domain-containing protein